jgi:hypothetical protein
MIIIGNQILMFLSAERIDGVVCEYSPYPSFKRTIVLVFMQVSEQFDESFLDQLFSLVKVFGVSHAHTQHFTIELFVYPLLASAIVSQTTRYEFL